MKKVSLFAAAIAMTAMVACNNGETAEAAVEETNVEEVVEEAAQATEEVVEEATEEVEAAAEEVSEEADNAMEATEEVMEEHAH